MLPNFLIIGAAKCGTTSLYRQLQLHPDIFLPPRVKEPTFFSEHGVGTWKRGRRWYQSLFANWRGERAVGEASTSYTKAPWYGDAPEKIHSLVPNVKLIYMVRDPFAQIYSHYRHMTYFDKLECSLEDALKCDTFLVSVASYAMQISRFLNFFRKDQILLVPFEEYCRQPVRKAQQVCEFLEVNSSIELVLDQPENQAEGRKKVRPFHIPMVYEVLRKRAPYSFMQIFDSALTTPLPKPELSEDASSHLAKSLAPEVLMLKQLFESQLEEWCPPIGGHATLDINE